MNQESSYNNFRYVVPQITMVPAAVPVQCWVTMVRCAVAMESVREVGLGRAMASVSVTRSTLEKSVISAVRTIIRASR